MGNDVLDTDALVTLASQGDASARESLLERHRDRLRRMIDVRLDKRLARRVDASDVLQESMAAAAQQLSDYLRTRPIPFYPWIRQIAWEQLVEVHRWHFRKKRHAGHDEPLRIELNDDSACELASRFVARQASPSGHLMRKELISRVRSAMDSLEPVDREVLTLRHLEQLTTSETADTLGISVSAAKSRHFRAMQRIMRILDKTVGADIDD